MASYTSSRSPRTIIYPTSVRSTGFPITPLYTQRLTPPKIGGEIVPIQVQPREIVNEERVSYTVSPPLHQSRVTYTINTPPPTVTTEITTTEEELPVIESPLERSLEKSLERSVERQLERPLEIDFIDTSSMIIIGRADKIYDLFAAYNFNRAEIMRELSRRRSRERDEVRIY